MSTRNLPWNKGAAGALGWHSQRHLWDDCVENVGASMSLKPMCLHGLLHM
jgi:hypothetical protein